MLMLSRNAHSLCRTAALPTRLTFKKLSEFLDFCSNYSDLHICFCKTCKFEIWLGNRSLWIMSLWDQSVAVWIGVQHVQDNESLLGWGCTASFTPHVKNVVSGAPRCYRVSVCLGSWSFAWKVAIDIRVLVLQVPYNVCMLNFPICWIGTIQHSQHFVWCTQ